MTGPKRLIGLLALAVLCLVPSSHARLGESLDQLVARFGKEGKPHEFETRAALAGETRYAFHSNGYRIIAGFVKGKCEYLQYYKSLSTYIPAEEREALMKANGNNQLWARLDDPKQAAGKAADKSYGGSLWMRTDKLAFATQSMNRITLESRAYRDAQAAKAQHEAKRKASEAPAPGKKLDNF